jgi:hypothetical protein
MDGQWGISWTHHTPTTRPNKKDTPLTHIDRQHVRSATIISPFDQEIFKSFEFPLGRELSIS